MTDILNVKVNGEWVGIPAIKGEDGEGVPTGGTTGQVLTKKTDTDYDTKWQTFDTIPSQTGQSGKYLTTDGSSASWGSISTVTDVQINGTSIVSSNIANIATNTAYNASSNKIATMSDVPSITNLANKDLSNISSTGEARFNGKADIDLTNINNTGKIAIAHNAMPSDTYEDLTLGASGSTYTAPTDGYFTLSKTNGTNFYGVVMINESNGLRMESTGGSIGIASVIMPASKGDIVTVVYSSSGAVTYFRFVYLQGSESEA